MKETYHQEFMYLHTGQVVDCFDLLVATDLPLYCHHCTFAFSLSSHQGASTTTWSERTLNDKGLCAAREKAPKEAVMLLLCILGKNRVCWVKQGLVGDVIPRETKFVSAECFELQVSARWGICRKGKGREFLSLEQSFERRCAVHIKWLAVSVGAAYWMIHHSVGNAERLI